MRIVVLTALPDIESTPWWPVITGTTGVTAILIVQKTASRRPGTIARRFWRNVREHGLGFVPYRAAVLAGSLVARVFRHEDVAVCPAPLSIEVRRQRTLDMHHPYVLESVQDWNPDLGVSVGAPTLRPELFAIPRLGTLDVHLGEVPEFRGAPPGFWELWYGAAEIGAAVHWVDAGLDTGAVLESASAPIYEHDSMARVEARAAELGRRLLASAIRRVTAGDARGSRQSSGGRTNRMPTIGQRFALWRRLLWRHARARAADPLVLAKLAAAFVWLTFWRPVRDLFRTITGRHPVRVFTYHRVTDLRRDEITVSEQTFRRQLAYLRRHHAVVDLDRAFELLEPGRRLCQPVAVITFDGGCRSVSDLEDPALTREVRDPLPTLCERLRLPHVAMAYPFGEQADITPDGILAAKRAGYSALASIVGGENFPGDDPFTIRRIDVGGDHDPLMWKAAMHGLDFSAWRRRVRREVPQPPAGPPASESRAAPVMRRPIRVTHIVFDLEGGGMETLIATMAKRWHNTDVRMSVVTLSGRVGRVGEQVRPFVEQFHIPRLIRGLSMAVPHGVARAIRSTRPDVVHVHTGAWLKGAYAARLAGAPRVVYTEHGREHHDPALTRVQDHVASLCTHQVVAVSERLRAYMLRAVGVRAEKLVTISNGVDTDVFRPGAADASLRRSLQIPENALVLGSVGRLERVKAYVQLVAAYADLRRADFGRPLVLVIFGEGGDRPAIEREIDRLGVRDGVRLPGWTDHPAEGYRLFDLFAMTSTSEGMSVSLIEAMACGVCPVVTDVGSNAEVVGPELGDHIIPSGDHVRFVRMVRHLLASASDRNVAGAHARRRATERYSVRSMVEMYERLYRAESVEAIADEPLSDDHPHATVSACT